MLRKLATAVLSCLVRDWSRKYHSLAATYGTPVPSTYGTYGTRVRAMAPMAADGVQWLALLFNLNS